jgi:hypothetical protein
MCFGAGAPPMTPAPAPPPPPTPLAQRVEPSKTPEAGGYASKRMGTSALRTDLTIGTPNQMQPQQRVGSGAINL